MGRDRARLLGGVVAVVAVLGLVGCGRVATPATSGPRAAVATVAVLDTGIDPSVRLDGRLDRARSKSLVPGEGLADADGHGTAMASIVHAAAPEAKVVVVKVAGTTGTTDARLAEGIDQAAAVGVDVVLVAQAGAGALPRTHRAIERAGRRGVLVVAAAGNDGVDLGAHPAHPAADVAPNLVAVAATDRRGSLLGSSNRGAPIGARGDGEAVPACGLGGEQTTATGTSPAAALVAARAARFVAEGRRATSTAVRRELGRGWARAARVRCP
ncbi:MAG: S8 family serine peptidase [Acidimicrobiales bacterium]